MHSRFIKLYDDNGYEYIVNMDKITAVDIAGKKVWAEGKTTLDICGESMDRLCDRLVGDGE
nr:MAG TPA: Flagellar and Swarming motility protein [Caudoviricetes sp.]